MFHVLVHLPPKCTLIFFPSPKGQVVKRLRTPPSKVLKEQRYINWKEGWDRMCLKLVIEPSFTEDGAMA